MLPKTSLNRPIIVMEQIEIEIEALLSYLATVRSALDKPINVQALLDLQRRLVRVRSYLASTVGLAGLQPFMRSSSGLNNASYDWSASVAATNTPGQNVVDWIKTNTGGTTVTFQAGDDPQQKTIDASTLVPLIDALVSAINT